MLSYIKQSVVEAARYRARLPLRVFQYAINPTRSQPQDDSTSLETISEGSNADNCSICHDTIDRPVRMSPCNHVFNKDCILQWMQQQNKDNLQNTCATCRAPVEEICCPTEGIIFSPHRIQNMTDIEALRILQDDEHNSAPESVRLQVASAVLRIWVDITTYPETYVMTRDEFAIFNYHSQLFRPEDVEIRKVVARYWDSRRS